MLSVRQLVMVPVDGPVAMRLPLTNRTKRLSAVTVTGIALGAVFRSRTRRKCSTTDWETGAAAGWVIQPSAGAACAGLTMARLASTSTAARQKNLIAMLPRFVFFRANRADLTLRRGPTP